MKIILDKKLYLGRENLYFKAGYKTLAKIVRGKAKNSPFYIDIDGFFRSILIKIELKDFGYINNKKNKHKYDIIYFPNVLEHIYDDIKSLNVLQKKSQ